MSPADVTVQTLVLWVAAFAGLLGFGTTIWNIFSSGARNNAKRISELAQETASKLTDLDRSNAALKGRLDAMERSIAAAPGREDVHALHIALADLKGDMKAMQATMEGNGKIMQRLETIVTRHEDHLLDGGRK